MRKPWSIDEDAQIVRITTRVVDSLPGIEGQFVPAAGAVTLTVPIAKLKLTEQQERLLIQLAGPRYIVDEGMLKYEVADFPFKELNERRAEEILRSLITYVKVCTREARGGANRIRTLPATSLTTWLQPPQRAASGRTSPFPRPGCLASRSTRAGSVMRSCGCAVAHELYGKSPC